MLAAELSDWASRSAPPWCRLAGIQRRTGEVRAVHSDGRAGVLKPNKTFPGDGPWLNCPPKPYVGLWGGAPAILTGPEVGFWIHLNASEGP